MHAFRVNKVDVGAGQCLRSRTPLQHISKRFQLPRGYVVSKSNEPTALACLPTIFLLQFEGLARSSVLARRGSGPLTIGVTDALTPGLAA
ncbi:hypothetical protein EVAR_14601_1 [Eumeta japonica]|uniref:Uncharacterized protein n=1 Tax=Eumeta variegata TaxID=151549 RepID=A0A4C1UVR7_EUMVA|nr:hypothetical protein EVAR_14601_1 [Eumeta japonica]